jgi:hypothetical protein
MKMSVIAIMIVAMTMTSCSTRYFTSIFKGKITVQDAIKVKEEIDKSDNPAFKYSKTQHLTGKLIEVKNAVVKDIIPSSNIDYRFCTIVEVKSDKGKVECYIYAKDSFDDEDLGTISGIIKGKTQIDAVGDFSRFFSLLDDAYVKIEIINADIDIRGNK